MDDFTYFEVHLKSILRKPMWFGLKYMHIDPSRNCFHGWNGKHEQGNGGNAAKPHVKEWYKNNMPKGQAKKWLRATYVQRENNDGEKVVLQD